jgi:hypothetical protein
MKISFKFLDKKEWSMYATINTIIPFFALLLTCRTINLKNIIFSSIINMMEGDLLPKILFTGFLNFMTMENNINWLIESIIYILSVIIVHYIPYNNKIHRFVYNNNFITYIFIIAIILWVLFIFKEIINNTKIIIYNNLYCQNKY